VNESKSTMSVPSSRLNSLPKDILIYLVETIQDKQNVQIKKLKALIKYLENDTCRHMDYCVANDCDNLRIRCEDYPEKYIETSPGNGVSCRRCRKYWCSYHIEESPLVMLIHFKDLSFNCGPVCSGKCYDEYTEPAVFYAIDEFKTVPLRNYLGGQHK
jgi:hypothetical protein